MNILGDKTIISLLSMLDMEAAKKQELIDLLPYMDTQDREGLLEDLLKLFSLQIDRASTLKRAQMVKDDLTHPGKFDWNKFNNTQEEVVKDMLAKAA